MDSLFSREQNNPFGYEEASGDPAWIFKALPVGICFVFGVSGVLLTIPQIGDAGAVATGVTFSIGVAFLIVGELLRRLFFAGRQSDADLVRNREAEGMTAAQLEHAIADLKKRTWRGAGFGILGVAFTWFAFVALHGWLVVGFAPLLAGLHAVFIAPKQLRRYKRALTTKAE